MTTSFAELKRSATKDFDKLNEELSKLNVNNQKNEDENYWKPTYDKAGNAYAIIRFLPAPAGEDLPFVRIWTHGFQGPTGKWYIENSLTTIGKPDPVSELNTQLWNVSSDDNSPTRKQARNQKRKLNYHSNIYVIKDSLNPEAEGKVFKFRYGSKIWDKINEQMHPPFEGMTKVNPFNFWEGANFHLRIRQTKGADGKNYPNYDSSAFDQTTSALADDDKLEEIWKQQYSLQEIIDPKNFKSYEELKSRLNLVLAPASVDKDEVSSARSKVVLEEEDTPPWEDAPKQYEKSSPKPVSVATDDDDDDDLAFFKSLAEDE